jgi:hypothetical protein
MIVGTVDELQKLLEDERSTAEEKIASVELITKTINCSAKRSY